MNSENCGPNDVEMNMNGENHVGSCDNEIEVTMFLFLQSFYNTILTQNVVVGVEGVVGGEPLPPVTP